VVHAGEETVIRAHGLARARIENALGGRSNDGRTL
jgi:hypothetical protein